MREELPQENTENKLTSSSITTGLVFIDGSRLSYEMQGKGHPLVLIQGGGLLYDRRIWDAQFSVFAHHYTVIRYDVRGVGQSDVSPEQKNLPYAPEEDIAQILKDLGIERTYVLGLSSVGSPIALDLTLRYPELVDALILASPGLIGVKSIEEILQALPKRREQFQPAYDALITGNVEQVVDVFMADSSAPLEKYPDARRHAREIMIENIHLVSSPPPLPDVQQQLRPPTQRHRLSEIRVPTLILVGEHDTGEIQENAQILATEIVGARKEVLPETRHVMNMERPEAFNRLVMQFLNTLLS
jgi:pimeloyl-ACP methyl ester carboxylesterase